MLQSGTKAKASRRGGGVLITLLALALTAIGIVATGPNATAADGDSGTFIGLRWKTYADTAGQACNPQQKGQSAGRIAFYLTFEGKNKKTGAIEKFDSPYYMPEIKYCEDLRIPIKKEMQNIEETATYTDISAPKQAHWYVDGKYFRARATGSANLFDEGDTYWISLVQQANQDVNNTKLTGMIAPWHEGKLKVAASYDIQETGKERKPYTSGNGKFPYFEGVFEFKDGESFSMISLPARDGQNALKKLTPATGRFKNWNEYTGKHKDFFLKAQFLDKEVAAAPYYQLNVTGDDIKGWEIELVSKLQKKEYQAKKTVPFKVERRANPKLAKGQERIVQQGVMGSEVTPMLKYFYLDDNNAEQIVKDEASGETVKTAAKNQIVEYGTAEKAAVKPDNKDHAAPRLKDTGVNSWGVLAASLTSLAGGAALILARRRTVK